MQRNIKKIIKGMATQDGAGVKLTRVLGARDVRDIDPFLMLDAFDSRNPDDYTKGFPWHPHRGIETFTYLIEGKIEHQDSLGNKGILGDNEAQWMTAGSGIIHQEMPKAAPRMLGLQLWINLPQVHKMTTPAYWDIKAKDMLELKKEDQTIRIISGELEGLRPEVQPKYVAARILDVQLKAGATFTLDTPTSKTVFLYLFEGLLINSALQNPIQDHSVALFSEGDTLSLTAKNESRFVVFEGMPLNEPVAFGGPIVMNTQAELMQAFKELDEGTFIR
jgi:redox-sensitive bicupin YhaK (pirin superfamily)